MDTNTRYSDMVYATIIANAKHLMDDITPEEGILPGEKNLDARKIIDNVQHMLVSVHHLPGHEDVESILGDEPRVYDDYGVYESKRHMEETYAEINEVGESGNWRAAQDWKEAYDERWSAHSFYHFNLKMTYADTKEVIDYLYTDLEKRLGQDPQEWVQDNVIPTVENVFRQDFDSYISDENKGQLSKTKFALLGADSFSKEVCETLGIDQESPIASAMRSSLVEETVVVAKAAHSRDFSHELAALRESNNVNSNKRTVLRCVTPIRMV